MIRKLCEKARVSLSLTLGWFGTTVATIADARPNALFIAADDLRNDLAFLGHPLGPPRLGTSSFDPIRPLTPASGFDLGSLAAGSMLVGSV